MELSINTLFSAAARRELSEAQMLTLLADAGFRTLELSLDWLCTPELGRDPSKCRAYAQGLKALALERNLRFSQAQLPYGFDWMMRDTDVLNYVVYPCMERSFEICEELGIPVAVAQPVTHPMTIGLPSRKFTWNVTYFDKLAQLGTPHGVTVAVENMPGTFDTAGEVLSLLENVPQLAVCVNTGHSNLAGEAPGALIRGLGRHVAALHLSGNQGMYDECMVPGVDQMDWGDILQALADAGYDGDFTLHVSDGYTGALDGTHGFGADFLPSFLDFAHGSGEFLLRKLTRMRDAT